MANRVMTLGRDRGRAPAGWPRGPTLKSHPEVVVRARLAAMATVARPVLLERDAERSADPSFAALNGLYWLVSNLTEGAPTLVAVDDAHWCDQASLRFLSFLLPRLEDLPLLLVVATRPRGDDAALAVLAADPAARLLRPRTLTRDAAAEAADALVAAGVLEPGRPLSFAHPLLRAAVYGDTPAARRAARHARAAELLRIEGAEPERIAAHLVATDAGDAEATVD